MHHSCKLAAAKNRKARHGRPWIYKYFATVSNRLDTAGIPHGHVSIFFTCFQELMMSCWGRNTPPPPARVRKRGPGKMSRDPADLCKYPLAKLSGSCSTEIVTPKIFQGSLPDGSCQVTTSKGGAVGGGGVEVCEHCSFSRIST